MTSLWAIVLFTYAPLSALHMAQLMPLPLTVSCFSKIQIGFTFLVPAHPGSPEKGVVKRVCVLVEMHAEPPPQTSPHHFIEFKFYFEKSRVTYTYATTQ